MLVPLARLTPYEGLKRYMSKLGSELCLRQAGGSTYELTLNNVICLEHNV